MVSPSSRQQVMSKKSTSSLRDLTLLTASPKEHTGMPSLVKRSSGSLVKLPASTTRLKLTTSLSSLSVPYKANNTGTFSVLKRHSFRAFANRSRFRMKSRHEMFHRWGVAGADERLHRSRLRSQSHRRDPEEP